MRWLCSIYTRGAHYETESEHFFIGGYDRKVKAIRLGTSHQCESGDHGLDLVGEGKEWTDPWSMQYQ